MREKGGGEGRECRGGQHEAWKEQHVCWPGTPTSVCCTCVGRYCAVAARGGRSVVRMARSGEGRRRAGQDVCTCTVGTIIVNTWRALPNPALRTLQSHDTAHRGSREAASRRKVPATHDAHRLAGGKLTSEGAERSEGKGEGREPGRGWSGSGSGVGKTTKKIQDVLVTSSSFLPSCARPCSAPCSPDMFGARRRGPAPSFPPLGGELEAWANGYCPPCRGPVGWERV